jgi:L-cysteine/cystine lyase
VEKETQSTMVIETLQATEARVEALRAQLPAVLTTGYFNTGSYGPIPTVVHDASAEVARREYEEGRIAPGGYDRNRARNRDVATLAADTFGANTDEIALTHSTSEGLGIALMGLAWRAGDEVVTTSEEHPGLLIPLSLLAHRFGVVSRYAAIGDGSGDVVGAVAGQITPRTRVIALSHVLWSTGAVLPLREISDLARSAGALVIVDGAQAAGHVPVDLHALGIDAYAMAGQKWLCGPESTGLLYVRRDRFPDIAPTYARYGQFETSGFFLPVAGAQRYEVGEFNGPAIAGQQAALSWLRDEVGLEWAYGRTAALGQTFRRGLEAVDGVEIVTPSEPMGGLVNFNIEGMPPRDVAAALLTRGYTIRYVDTRPCCVSARASIGWWNTEDEVAGLIAAVAEVAAEGLHGRD